MFTTVEYTQRVTGRTVSLDLLYRAQAVIEMYIGRVEEDIVSPDDLALLQRAVSFQAAYMLNNEDIVYEQMSALQVLQASMQVTFRNDDKTSPWIAPMAVMACRNLSWKRSRSVRTGPILGRKRRKDWWTD
ncbi:head-to-tail adaptor [Satellite phage MiniFlayer]|nr:head-to-tail adaptor [Satellite phage MiniFlayer]